MINRLSGDKNISMLRKLCSYIGLKKLFKEVLLSPMFESVQGLCELGSVQGLKFQLSNILCFQMISFYLRLGAMKKFKG